MLRRLIRSITEPPPPERGTLAWSSMYPDEGAPRIPRPATDPAAVRRVGSSTSPVSIAIANPYRGALTVVNDSTAILYLKHGPGASTIAGGYTVALGAGATYVLEPPDVYRGEVSGVWAAVNGAASVTETR